MATIKLTSTYTAENFEQKAWNSQEVIMGVDEVGRGCLSGPVVATATILKPYAYHKLLKDSKLLSEKQRLQAYTWLMSNSYFAVSFMHHRHIDTHNIYQATLHVMKRSITQLLTTISQKPEAILIDAMPVTLSDITLPIYYFSGGEEFSVSIAAASIIAKVTRDTLMHRLGTVIPGYAFGQHKGYATVVHKQALTMLGKSIIHRDSFLKKFL